MTPEERPTPVEVAGLPDATDKWVQRTVEDEVTGEARPRTTKPTRRCADERALSVCSARARARERERSAPVGTERRASPRARAFESRRRSDAPLCSQVISVSYFNEYTGERVTDAPLPPAARGGKYLRRRVERKRAAGAAAHGGS